MKYRIFLFVIISILGFRCWAGEVYAFNDSQNRIHYSISLDNDIYDISCTVYTGHSGLILPLSIGLTIQDKDTLLLIDVANGYSMKAIYSSEKTLTIISGYEALRGMIFDYRTTNKSLDFTKKIVLKKKEDFLKNSSFCDSLLYNLKTINKKNVDTGLYVYSVKSDTVYFENIRLGKSRYQYRFNNVILSEGTWRVFNGYILFKDETLNAYFSAKIEGENEFTTIKFPSALPITLKLLK